VSPCAAADLVVVDGNPPEDLRFLAGRGERLPLIMRAGEIVKAELR